MSATMEDMHTAMAASVEDAAACLRALSNPSRLLLLCHLVEGERSVGGMETALGLGQAYVGSALSRDYSVLLGVTILYGALTVIVNLITDLAYAWFDPKIRY